jgi:YidC/Oxa1 family membrane protein insertase
MDRNTTIAFILIGGILILWLYLNSPDPSSYRDKEKTQTTFQSDSASAEKIQDDTIREKSSQIVSQQTAPTKDSLDYGLFFTTIKSEEQIITVENQCAIIELSSNGGNIRKYYLKEFKNWYSAKDNGTENFYRTSVQLINFSRGNAYNLSFVTSDGKAINTSDFPFKSSSNKSRYSLSKNDSVTITYSLKTKTGGELKKTYTFYGNKYHIKSDIELIGFNDLISNNAYDLVWDSGIRFVEENSVDEAQYSNASLFYGGEQVIVDASDIGQTRTENYNGRVDWIAVRNKYFAAIMVPFNSSFVEGAYIEGEKRGYPNGGMREFYSIRLVLPFKNTDYEKQSLNIYVGPVDYNILSEYGQKLEAIVDFGSFFGLKFIVRPIAEYLLLPLFTFLHSFIPNYGLVIIVFSLIIKFVLHPLTKKSYQSMKKMQLLQPKIAELKEKYKDDPQKMNKETMKLYSTYGVNPAGGCFPLLLQMPIFVALWGLFQVAIDLRQQPFIFWITDLSRPDVILDMGFKLPLFGIDKISGLALLMGITTFIQQKMSIKDPKQQSLVYIMPVMLTLIFMAFPSGLNLYYFMFNLFSIAQQYYINHKHDGMVLEPVKNPAKKKGFMQRMMAAAEESAKSQQQRKKKK